MKEFLLFIDTETTDIPKKWNLPYSDTKNWPSAVQVSWMICKQNGDLISKNSFYINVKELKVSKNSIKIHGIKNDFLLENGSPRKDVLELLAQDIQQYKPLIVGHFVEFDLHTLSTDYHREGLQNPFLDATFFCTLLVSNKFVQNPSAQYLRLPQLCEHLFKEGCKGFHNADVDREMTAKCFFKLLSQNEISEQEFHHIHQQIKDNLKF